MTSPHLKTGVESTPETLCKKHFRQWILSDKFINIVTNLSSLINYSYQLLLTH